MRPSADQQICAAEAFTILPAMTKTLAPKASRGWLSKLGGSPTADHVVPSQLLNTLPQYSAVTKRPLPHTMSCRSCVVPTLYCVHVSIGSVTVTLLLTLTVPPFMSLTVTVRL